MDRDHLASGFPGKITISGWSTRCAAGVAERLRLAVLAAYDRMLGLELEQLSVDGCITKGPCGTRRAG